METTNLDEPVNKMRSALINLMRQKKDKKIEGKIISFNTTFAEIAEFNDYENPSLIAYHDPIERLLKAIKTPYPNSLIPEDILISYEINGDNLHICLSYDFIEVNMKLIK